MSDRSREHAAVAVLIFLLLNAVLLAGMRLLPFIDLPNHLAEATIFKFHEPGNVFSQYYQPVPWFFPNTFHTVFCSLFPSVEWGNRVFFILYIIALSGSVFLVVRQLNGNPWYGALAALFTYNYNVTFGFVGFAISIPALFLLLYLFILYAQTGKMYLNFLIAFTLVLLFFMHAQNALMGLIIYACLLLYHYRKSLWKFVFHIILVPLPMLLMFLTWWLTRADEAVESSTVAYLLRYYTSHYFQNFSMRFGIVAFDNFQLREGFAGLLLATFFFSCIMIPLFGLRGRTWETLKYKLSSPAVIYSGIFFLVSLACYLFAPDKLPGQSPIFQRFCTIVIISFIIFGSVILGTSGARTGWLKYFVAAAVLLYTVLWGEYMYTFNRRNEGFNESLFNGIEPSRRLAGLIYDNRYRGRRAYIHFPNYYIVWKHGIAASKIIDYRFGVVRKVESNRVLPFYDELIGERYPGEAEYSGIDYLLVRGRPPVPVDIHLEGANLVREQEPWRLFVRR